MKLQIKFQLAFDFVKFSLYAVVFEKFPGEFWTRIPMLAQISSHISTTNILKYLKTNENCVDRAQNKNIHVKVTRKWASLARVRTASM